MAGTPDSWIEHLTTRLAEGRVAFVCGTGVSAAISHPTDTIEWRGLLRSGVNYLAATETRLVAEAGLMKQLLDQPGANATTLLSVADWVRGQFRERPEGDYRLWLSSTVGRHSVRPDAPQYLAHTSAPLLTSNYDDSLTQLTGRAVMDWTDRGRIDRFFDEPSKYVFHLHGHWDNPKSVILSSTDYQKLSQAPTVNRAFESLAAGYTFVFLGYGAGVGDPNYSGFLDWFEANFSQTGRPAYLLCRNDAQPDRLVDTHGLRYLPYGDRYADLWELLQAISPKPAAEHARTESADHDSTGDQEGEAPQADDLAALPENVRREVIDQLGSQDTWSEFQNKVFAAECRIAREGGGALIAAVTGTGKTTISRAVMNVAVAQNAAAVMLAPTKALVAQEIREWDRWVNAWNLDERQIRVYPASRDYPESDAPVARGRFEIAVAIYEKLAGFLTAGQRTLDNTALLIVDELQTLVEDDERARKLEALLTMVRLRPVDRRPAIVGLSATLSRRATDTLRTWLQIPGPHYITSVDRPVPLDTFVLDSRRIRRQPDAHLVALGDMDDSNHLPAWSETEHHIQIGENARLLGLPGLANAPIGVSLVVKLLVEDPTRRIIAFVPGRTAAEEIALAIQKELDKSLGQPSRRANPWREGRYANAADVAHADTKYDALRHSDLPMCEPVLRGIRTGVAYHTARLPAQLRRLLEDEFRDPNGVLRVLIATDTLAQGVNLPADAVVSFSIATYGRSRTAVLSTAAQLDNKAGRAGRRGLAARERGEFYIVVPTARDLQDVSNLTAAGLKRLATIEGVFEDFVTRTARTASITGHIRSLDEVSLLSLQVLASDGFAREIAKIEARVDAVIRNLLAAQEQDVSLPVASVVVAHLQNLKLLGLVSNTEKFLPTPLGFALARSALSLQSAYVLEQLGRLATAGSGDIDLLFNAFRSPEIQEVSAWVGMPAVEERHKPSIKERLTTYAMAYCAPSSSQRSMCASYFGASKQVPVREWVDEGQKVISVELSDLLERDVEQIDDRDATALLRALVAFEWSRGAPFLELKARISSAIRSDEDQRGKRPVEVKIHYSDVEQLCEQAAGVIRGAAAVSYSDSHDWSLLINALALRVEVGLPTWLAPIARMRHPLLHRNRLARLWRAVPDHDHLSEILDMPEMRAVEGISDVQREQLRQLLDQREFEDALHRHRVAQAWAGELVPGLEGATFEEFGLELEAAADATEYAALLGELADALGIPQRLASVGPDYHLLEWGSQGHGVMLAIPIQEIGGDEVNSVADRDCLVLLRTRLRPSAQSRFASKPTAARFIRPEILLEVVAKLVEVRGAGLDPSEAVERLRQLRVSVLDPEEVSLSLETVEGPPPFSGPLPVRPNDPPLDPPREDLAD